MKDLLKKTQEYVDYAKTYLELDPRDEFYVGNRVLEILQNAEGDELTADERDSVFGALSLPPSALNDRFQKLLKKDGKAATDYFYDYCVHNDYVKKAALDKNPRFESNGLIVTINKAKPEFRDPKKAASGNSVDGGFAKCVICRQNEGYGGRAKRNLRTVDLTLGGEHWFWQYSPYGYFNQHGIAVNCEHIPMHVDASTFGKLMDFTDMFPHYFIGCNAALPRIGGSVLAHDHYQGGGEVLPMHKAKALETLKNKAYSNAVVEVVDWPGSVVRIVSKDRRAITEIGEIIRKKWVGYNNPELGIIAEDKDGIHNAVSPTVVKTKRGYEMSIIFRSNITSERYPDGVFHAHPEFHAVKKESIGLIEAQGLFILPGRLEAQLDEIAGCIERGDGLPSELAEFGMLYDEAYALYAVDKSAGAHSAIKKELGSICYRILENTAVFNKAQIIEFMRDLGFEK